MDQPEDVQTVLRAARAAGQADAKFILNKNAYPSIEYIVSKRVLYTLYCQ